MSLIEVLKDRSAVQRMQALGLSLMLTGMMALIANLFIPGLSLFQLTLLSVSTFLLIYLPSIFLEDDSIRGAKEEASPSAQKTLKELVSQYLDSTQESTLDDIEAIYRSSFDTLRIEEQGLVRILGALDTALVELITSASEEASEGKASKADAARRHILEVKKGLAVFQEKAPFFGTPEIERELLEDVRRLAPAVEVKDKLVRIADSVRAREEVVRRLEKDSRRSLLWAYSGFSLTAIFGVLSIYFALSPKASEISEKPTSPAAVIEQARELPGDPAASPQEQPDPATALDSSGQHSPTP
ncbi:MAG: hypothetical protein K0U98_11520 [Deltaproteobacteria bacterium]|nr:hypothetical protein [Deltaproteobacteria bacterium]